MIKTLLGWMVGSQPKVERTPEQQKAHDAKIMDRLALTYVVIALLTFGYSAARYPAYTNWEGREDKSLEYNGFATVGGAVVAGLVWPVYWTLEGFSLVIEPVTVPVQVEVVTPNAAPINQSHQHLAIDPDQSPIEEPVEETAQ